MLTSTSGRPAVASSFADELVSEMYQHNAEIDAIVRMECERLRAGLEQARKRQCQALVRAVSAAAEHQERLHPHRHELISPPFVRGISWIRRSISPTPVE